MNTKLLIAASVAALSLATAAYAGEANNEPFPLSISIGSNGQTYVSTLPETAGLPRGFQDGTPAYQQAQSATRWYAQQGDHRFTQQRPRQTSHNG